MMGCPEKRANTSLTGKRVLTTRADEDNKRPSPQWDQWWGQIFWAQATHDGGWHYRKRVLFLASGRNSVSNLVVHITAFVISSMIRMHTSPIALYLLLIIVPQYSNLGTCGAKASLEAAVGPRSAQTCN